jgi:hypothetical protein
MCSPLLSSFYLLIGMVPDGVDHSCILYWIIFVFFIFVSSDNQILSVPFSPLYKTIPSNCRTRIAILRGTRRDGEGVIPAAPGSDPPNRRQPGPSDGRRRVPPTGRASSAPPERNTPVPRAAYPSPSSARRRAPPTTWFARVGRSEIREVGAYCGYGGGGRDPGDGGFIGVINSDRVTLF